MGNNDVCFYTDTENVDNAIPEHFKDDAFGPNSESLRFRLTSWIRLKKTSNVYALCNGHMMYFKNEKGEKDNIVLIPENSPFSPLKIKYVIYRGVDIDISRAQTEFYEKSEKNDENNEEPLDLLWANRNLFSHVKAGAQIGTVSERLGIDIVLYDCDYQKEIEQNLFPTNIGFCRKEEGMIICDDKPNELKNILLRENAIHFVDVAALLSFKLEKCDIFNPELIKWDKTDAIKFIKEKFQTGDCIYLYIFSNDGHPYGFHKKNEKSIDTVNNEWPIIIIPQREIGENEFNLSLKVSYQVGLYPLFPIYVKELRDKKTLYLRKGQKPTINIPKEGNKHLFFYSCISANFESQILYKENKVKPYLYFDNLWPSDINTGNTNKKNTFNTFQINKRTIINLMPIDNKGCLIKNYVVIGNGMRLYIAQVIADSAHEQLGSDIPCAKNISTNSYIKDIYGDLDSRLESNFELLHGTFKFDKTAEEYNSFSLVHRTDFDKRDTFLQLGITDDEYNVLHEKLKEKKNISNLYFQIKSLNGFVNEYVREYELIIRYDVIENGNFTQKSNDQSIKIYTLDDRYFYSLEYANKLNGLKIHKESSNVALNIESKNECVDFFNKEFKDLLTGCVDWFNTNQFTDKDQAYKNLKSEYIKIPTNSSSESIGAYILSKRRAEEEEIEKKKAFQNIEINIKGNCGNSQCIISVCSTSPLKIDANFNRAKKIEVTGKFNETLNVLIDKTFKHNIAHQIRIYVNGINKDEKEKELSNIIVIPPDNSMQKEIKINVFHKAGRSLSDKEKDILEYFGRVANIKFSINIIEVEKSFFNNFFKADVFESLLRGDSNNIDNIMCDFKYDKYQDFDNKISVFLLEKDYINSPKLAGRTSQSFKYILLLGQTNNYTLSHEVFHALGLLHTFKGKTEDPIQSYIFENITTSNNTNNIMSYEEGMRNKIWKWQINRIRKDI
ncbi:MAG: hypothetical protein IJJ78_03615 [Paludibacteraceae bacterium]|nr:hypothetical protein [Paludibacteraceae bacterium]